MFFSPNVLQGADDSDEDDEDEDEEDEENLTGLAAKCTAKTALLFQLSHCL